MRTYFLALSVVALVFLLAACTPTLRATCDDSDPSLKLLPSLVEVTGYHKDGSLTFGTGFIVDGQDGFILTAEHVIANAFRIDITLRNGVINPANSFTYNHRADIAILKTETLGLPAIETPESFLAMPEPGDCVYALGMEDGTYVTKAGVLEDYERDNAGNRLAILGFDTISGMSGGPIVNVKGEVFGVVSLTNIGIAFLPSDLSGSLEQARQVQLSPRPTPTRPRATPTSTPHTLSDLGQAEREIQDLDEAIRLNPQYAYAYNNRGVAYGELGQHERAIQDYDEAIRLNPQVGVAYMNRGVAYQAIGMSEEAARDIAKAKELGFYVP